MGPLHDERQFSLVAIILLPLVFGFILLADMMNPRESVPLWFIPVMILMMSCFMSMRVVVTRAHVRVSLTWGFPRKTIAIEDIRSFEVYERTGISALLGSKIKPSRGQWTMNGRTGLLIVPEKGIPVRISSNDPKRLRNAVRKAVERRRTIGRT